MDHANYISVLEEQAASMRRTVIELGHLAGKNGAHFGGSLSLVEILAVLYGSVKKQEDAVILSKGHGSLAYYTALFESGAITEEQLFSFEKNGGDFPGQSVKNKSVHIRFSGGSLGLGLPYACGIAQGKKLKKEGGTVFAILGDGECQEGCVWEAAFFAKQHGLDNLIVIVDQNRMQSDGECEGILKMNLAALWAAAGFAVINSDGHRIEEILTAFSDAGVSALPSAILFHTIKGKGISFMERSPVWHHNILDEKNYKQACLELTKGEDNAD